MIDVRRATIEDLPAIEHVQESAGMSGELDGIRAAVLDPQRFVVVAAAVDVVADADGVVVGWAKTHLYPHDDGAAPAGHYLGGVTVDPAWRRRGIGTALTDARMTWLAERTDRVRCLVDARNAASVALHERWGFRESARAPELHGVTFAGGVGLLLWTDLPARWIDDA